MAALFGYLVALAVFIGGGYAGMHWLTTPDDPVATATKLSVAPNSGTVGSTRANRTREAYARHRRAAETLAENKTADDPAPASPDDQQTAAIQAEPEPAQNPAAPPEPAKLPKETAQSNTKSVEVASAPANPPPPKSEQASAPDGAASEKTAAEGESKPPAESKMSTADLAAVSREATVGIPPAAASLDDHAVQPTKKVPLPIARPPLMAAKEPASGAPVAERKSTAENVRVAALTPPSKPSGSVRRLADAGPNDFFGRGLSSTAMENISRAVRSETRAPKRDDVRSATSRKPIMMVLRTIEYADGRRERHLLPLSEARYSRAMPRFARFAGRRAFAFDDDDDF